MKRIPYIIVVFIVFIVSKTFAQSFPEDSLNYVIEKAKQGNAEYQYVLGTHYYNIKDYNLAVYWTKKAADQGLISAQSNLGVCYFNGQGVNQDYDQAVFWYQKAADQGLISAQNNLALCYVKGTGVSQSHSMAAYWYKKAAEQGDAEAQVQLGILYKNG